MAIPLYLLEWMAQNSSRHFLVFDTPYCTMPMISLDLLVLQYSDPVGNYY